MSHQDNKFKRIPLTVRVSEAAMDDINTISQDAGISVSRVVRLALSLLIRDHYDKRGRES